MSNFDYLVDSHCHLDRLDLSKHDNNLANAIASAVKNGIGHMLCVSIDLESWPAMAELTAPFDNVSLSVGVHPNEQEGHDPSVEELVSLADNDRVVAIGETGLDYFRNTGDLNWQRDRFARHIEAARQTRKPLIIHTREAKQDTIDMMRAEKADEPGGVMHCFAEDWETARAALDLGFYISFSGIVTFKNAQELKEVAKKVPLERMLVETDSPYLAPVPHRGKPNEPAHTRLVAEHIADLRNTTYDEIMQATTGNYYRLFRESKQHIRAA